MKKVKNKYKTKESSINTVRQLFQNTDADSITLEEAYKAWGRDLAQVEENKAWLSNKLTSLRYHNLVVPIYAAQNNRRVLTQIQLTLEGKRAIGRLGEKTQSIEKTAHVFMEKSISIEDILKAIPKLQKENPDFEITFKVIPKEI